MTFFEKKVLILLKIYYLVLDVKLLINHVEFFFLQKIYRHKTIDKTFHSCWFDRLKVVSKKVMSVIDLDEN